MLPAFWAAGINVCLGTDSVASNDRLNLFDEMRALAHRSPELTAQRILELVTTCAARALGREQELGRLAAGAAADLIAVRPMETVVDPYETVVFNERAVPFVMVKGAVIRE